MPGMGGGHSGGGHSGGGSHGGGGGFHGGGSHGGGGFHGGGGGFHGGGPRGGGFHHGGPRGPRGPRGFWGPGWGWGWGPRHYGGGGCLAPFVFAAVFIVFILIFIMSSIGSCVSSVARPNDPQPDFETTTRVDDISGTVTVRPSTKVRQPLDAAYCTAIDKYVEDDMSAFATAAEEFEVINALKDFYLVTGVQPYLWVTNSLGGDTSPDFDTTEKYMYERYTAMFEDEGHLLILYFEYSDGTYNTWYMWGNDAHEYVMDDEACEILLDYIDYYYIEHSGSTVDYCDIFSYAFTEAASRIMGGITPADDPTDPAVSAVPDDGGSGGQPGAPAATAEPEKSGISTLGVVAIVLAVLLVCAIVGIVVTVVVARRRRDERDYPGMSADDIRKEKHRRKYGGD